MHNRVETLSNLLDDSVSLNDHQILSRKFQLLSDKYNTLLEREKEALQRHLSRVTEQREQKVKDEVIEEPQKEEIAKRLEGENLSSLKARIITLEISESNAKRKSQLAVKKLAASEEVQKEIESRVFQLEQEVIQLSQQKHQNMEVEIDLK